jgi:hypothetical protein
VLEETPCEVLHFGDLEVRIPDPKTLLKIKDSQLDAMRRDLEEKDGSKEEG